MTRVRIISNGQLLGSKCIDADTGEELDFEFTNVEIQIGAGGCNRAQIEVFQPVVDVVADAELTTVCPWCKRPVEDQDEPGPEKY